MALVNALPFFVILFTRLFSVCFGVDQVKDYDLNRIAFGSCNKHDRAQPLWEKIIFDNPDIWIWGGDIVYADKQILPLVWIPDYSHNVRNKWIVQKENPMYRKLVNSVHDVFGVVDDHDFGLNNGDHSFKQKDLGKECLLSFLDEDKDSIRHHRDGMYASYAFGGAMNKRVLLILLDVRYFSKDDDILGKDQWNWLENQLLEPAKVKLIVSGIQFLTTMPFVESWQKKQSSFIRFMKLLKSTRAQGVILLSGDVHFAEILECEEDDCKSNYPLVEFTSSGMTHTCVMNMPSFLCEPILRFLKSFFPYSRIMSAEHNYGLIDIDWDNGLLLLTAKSGSKQCSEEESNVLFTYNVSLSNLDYRQVKENGNFGILKSGPCGLNKSFHFFHPWIIAMLSLVVFTIGLAYFSSNKKTKKD